MSSTTCPIVLLNRSEAPPGYSQWQYKGRSVGGTLYQDIHGEQVGGLKEAWAHYEARHNPPGWFTNAPGWLTAFFARDAVGARKAAWAWYWRRVEVIGTVRAVCLDDGMTAEAFDELNLWPEILSRSDEQCDEAIAWAEQRGDLPDWLAEVEKRAQKEK